MAFYPAKKRIPITIQRMNLGFAILRIRTPMNEPKMIPFNEGTNINGITAPLLREIQAAKVSEIDSNNFEVATLILSGAPISRIRTGTVSLLALSPNNPAMNPMMMKQNKIIKLNRLLLLLKKAD